MVRQDKRQIASRRVKVGEALLAVFYKVYMSSTPISISFNDFYKSFPNVATEMIGKKDDVEKIIKSYPELAVRLYYLLEKDRFYAFFDAEAKRKYNVLKQTKKVEFYIPPDKLVQFALKSNL